MHTPVITNKRHNKSNKRHTRKLYYPSINGQILSKKQGWTIAHIWGEPYARGYAHGVLLYNELKYVLTYFEFMVKLYVNVPLDTYIETCVKVIKPILLKEFPEFYEELRGVSEGAFHKGVIITIDYLIAWNSVLSMDNYFTKTKDKHNRCSAFIATGSATADGQIVMGHNTHSVLSDAPIQNIILYITPSSGSAFVMQTSPGYIASGTDWFICKSGIIGCETTISDILYKPRFGTPYFCRIRQAMQYGKSLDDFANIMLNQNAGDYACSWLFGNVNTNEIMLFELGLNKHAISKTKDGVYYGMNSALNFELRTEETGDETLFDLTTSSGSRNVRLNQLLNNDYYGKLNIENAKLILNDHYDIGLHKDIMNSKGICKHSELDPVNPYPMGCTDGKVVDGKLAKKMAFIGRFGSCCGRTFQAKAFIKKNPRYKKWKPYLPDLPRTSWTLIQKG